MPKKLGIQTVSIGNFYGVFPVYRMHAEDTQFHESLESAPNLGILEIISDLLEGFARESGVPSKKKRFQALSRNVNPTRKQSFHEIRSENKRQCDTETCCIKVTNKFSWR